MLWDEYQNCYEEILNTTSTEKAPWFVIPADDKELARYLVAKLDGKVVLYRINNSKFGEYNKSKDNSVKETIIQLQEEELMTNLMKKLENSFDIKSSIQEKE